MRIALHIMALALWPCTLLAQDNTTETIALAPGADSLTVAGTLTGWQWRDYLVDGQAGDVMTITLDTEMNAFVNVGRADDPEFFFIGPETIDDFSQALPETTTYRIRILMMGADRDDGNSGPFEMTVAITD